MIRRICCGKIKLLIGILMMIMIVSKNSVRAYDRKDSHGRKEQNMKHSFMQKGKIMMHNI